MASYHNASHADFDSPKEIIYIMPEVKELSKASTRRYQGNKTLHCNPNTQPENCTGHFNNSDGMVKGDRKVNNFIENDEFNFFEINENSFEIPDINGLLSTIANSFKNENTFVIATHQGIFQQLFLSEKKDSTNSQHVNPLSIVRKKIGSLIPIRANPSAAASSGSDEARRSEEAPAQQALEKDSDDGDAAAEDTAEDAVAASSGSGGTPKYGFLNGTCIKLEFNDNDKLTITLEFASDSDADKKSMKDKYTYIGFNTKDKTKFIPKTYNGKDWVDGNSDNTLKEIFGKIKHPGPDNQKLLTFYFIRHGAAYHNPPIEINSLFKNRHLPQHFNTQLTVIGKFQAEQLYNNVFKNLVEVEHKEMVKISSPLDRAIETLILATSASDEKPTIKGKFDEMRESTNNKLTSGQKKELIEQINNLKNEDGTNVEQLDEEINNLNNGVTDEQKEKLDEDEEINNGVTDDQKEKLDEGEEDEDEKTETKPSGGTRSSRRFNRGSKRTRHSQSKRTRHSQSKRTRQRQSKRTRQRQSKRTRHSQSKRTRHSQSKRTRQRQSKRTRQRQSLTRQRRGSRRH